MNVLSLFDGMSCGQIALKELGVTPDVYYASEIDKHAIAQTQLNFPNTIQLGSVVDVDVLKLQHIDLLIGGSPCTSFSSAGKRKGMSTKCEIEITKLEQYLELKEQGFEFEGQSYLFWEYMRILTDIRKYNPDVKFLLENVEMGAKWERVLSEAIGVYGVHINSALVSAQSRKRIYWTNIRTKQVGLFGELHSDIPQPEDRGIVLKDILETDVDDKYYLSEKLINILQNRPYEHLNMKPRDINLKSSCLCAGMHKKRSSDNYIIQLNQSTESGGKQPYQQNGVYDSNGIAPALCANKADLLVKIPSKDGLICVGSLTGEKWDNMHDYNSRVYSIDGKMRTLTSMGSGNQEPKIMQLNSNQLRKFNPDADGEKHNCITGAIGRAGSSSEYMESVSKIANITGNIRKLTPLECSRLQTIPEWYIWRCSDTQAYRMLGNGWTIEVIKHILSFMSFS